MPCQSKTESDDRPRDHCGIFGVYGHPDAAWLTYMGLYALQHRGEESAGIVSADGRDMVVHKGMGLVAEVFTPQNLKALKGKFAIGHVRYSTTGSSHIKNAQPLLIDFSRGPVAVAHNGNLVNAKRLRDELEAYGSVFQTTTDSEIIIHLMAKPSYRSVRESIVESLKRIQGAWSLVFLTQDMMVAARDPYGFRPLCLGRLGDAWVVASESCALDLVQAQFVREIEPGEIVLFDDKGIESIKPFKEPAHRAMCIFEHVYFSRPDSQIFGDNVYQVRVNFGRELAREDEVQADLVVPIPDSGTCAALGYSEISGIPLAMGVIRNHYVGRTFIRPTQNDRDFMVKVKLNPIRGVLAGKRILVVDDSIVRGTTSQRRIQSLRQAGATEIHMRVSCPPHRNPCYYGIDFPSKEELIANRLGDEKEIAKFLGVESLRYLSPEGMFRAVSQSRQNYCDACYSGRYPLAPDRNFRKEELERR